MTATATGSATELSQALRSARTIYDLAPLYEAIYLGRGKDYAGEAATIVEVIRARRPGARDLLDVGCGPGTHLQYLSAAFDTAVGVDIADTMLAVASRRLPGVAFRRHDMRDFDLGRRFDAVTCLFSVIGNVTGRAELDATLRRLAAHLHPGGVLSVEPWWFTEDFTPGHVGGDLVEHDGVTIARVSHSVRRGESSHMEVHYVFARPGEGVWHFSDQHTMALFSRAEYEEAFAAAGLAVELLDLGNGGPGLLVGTRDGGR